MYLLVTEQHIVLSNNMLNYMPINMSIKSQPEQICKLPEKKYEDMKYIFAFFHDINFYNHSLSVGNHGYNKGT